MEGITQDDLEHVRCAAERGARDVTRNPLLVREAGERAVEAYETSCLSGKDIRSLDHWSRRVGRNVATALARRADVSRRREFRSASAAPRADGPVADSRETRYPLEEIGRLLEPFWVVVTKRQREVLQRLDPTVSVRQNAKRAGTTPYNLRRMLRCVGKRVRRASFVNRRTDATVSTSHEDTPGILRERPNSVQPSATAQD